MIMMENWVRPIQVLQSTGSGLNWVNAAAGGISIRDEGGVVGTAGSVVDLNFSVPGVTATASGVGATITIGQLDTANGLDGEVQYNNGGTLGGATGFVFLDSTNFVGIGSTNPQRQVTIGGDGTVHGNWYTERTFTTTNIPLDALEYVPKSYVDAIQAGIVIKAAVSAATTTALSGLTYTNGLSGVGAKLFPNVNGALVLDGVTLDIQQRVLIKDQGASGVGNTFENGFYEVTRVGSGSTSWELQRSNDSDEVDEVVAGAFAFVLEGTRNNGNGFVHLTREPVAIGTSAIEYTQFTAPGQVNAGDGLTKTANTLDVVTADSTAITVNPDSINLTALNPTQSTVSTGATVFVQSISVDQYGRITGVVTSNQIGVAGTDFTGVVKVPPEVHKWSECQWRRCS